MSVDRVCEMVVLRWLFSGLRCAVDSEEAMVGQITGSVSRRAFLGRAPPAVSRTLTTPDALCAH